jgi:arylsulfatase A-like enzyme
VDRSLDRVIRTLKKLDLYDDALIILTSDHGEEFWEHGGFEHGHSLYQEVIRVPLVIKRPGASSHARVDRPVSTGSLTSTILDLCGLEHEIEPSFHPSLAPFLTGSEENPPDQPILSTGVIYFEDRVGVLFDGMKYTRALVSGREELFDLAADPAERSSVAGERPEALERARRIVADHRRAAAETRRRYVGSDEEEAVADRERLEALRSLGYVD